MKIIQIIVLSMLSDATRINKTATTTSITGGGDLLLSQNEPSGGITIPVFVFRDTSVRVRVRVRESAESLAKN